MDNDNKDDKKSLSDWLDAYIRGTINPAQREKIERWLEKDVGATKFSQREYADIEKDIFERLRAGIAPRRLKRPVLFSRRRPWIAVGAAASIFLVGCVCFWLYTARQVSPNRAAVSTTAVELKTIETVRGQRIKITLPDSSLVYLHGNSKLRYHPDFGQQEERRVYLDHGEGFFSVRHNPSKPFIVQTEHAENRVLGTSFNIRLSGDDRLYHLTVNTGMVEFSPLGRRDTQKHLVAKGKHLVFNPQLQQVAIASGYPEETSSWTKNVLSFTNNDWEQVKEKLETWYGISMHIAPGLKRNQFFTATFDAPRLKEVLEGLRNINQFNYRITGKEVFID